MYFAEWYILFVGPKPFRRCTLGLKYRRGGHAGSASRLRPRRGELRRRRDRIRRLHKIFFHRLHPATTWPTKPHKQARATESGSPASRPQVLAEEPTPGTPQQATAYI